MRTILVHGKVDIEHLLNITCGTEDRHVDDKGSERELGEVAGIMVFDGTCIFEVVVIQGMRVSELFGMVRPVVDLG